MWEAETKIERKKKKKCPVRGEEISETDNYRKMKDSLLPPWTSFHLFFQPSSCQIFLFSLAVSFHLFSLAFIVRSSFSLTFFYPCMLPNSPPSSSVCHFHLLSSLSDTSWLPLPLKSHLPSFIPPFLPSPRFFFFLALPSFSLSSWCRSIAAEKGDASQLTLWHLSKLAPCNPTFLHSTLHSIVFFQQWHTIDHHSLHKHQTTP